MQCRKCKILVGWLLYFRRHWPFRRWILPKRSRCLMPKFFTFIFALISLYCLIVFRISVTKGPPPTGKCQKLNKMWLKSSFLFLFFDLRFNCKFTKTSFVFFSCLVSNGAASVYGITLLCHICGHFVILCFLRSIIYSLYVQEWKSTLFGIILGITSFGVEIHTQNSGIHSQKSDSNHYFGLDSTISRVDFHLQTKWSLIWLPKRFPLHCIKRVLNSVI